MGMIRAIPSASNTAYRRVPVIASIALHSDAEAAPATAALAIVGRTGIHQGGLTSCSAFSGLFLSALLPE
jgi:hypothetical protein